MKTALELEQMDMERMLAKKKRIENELKENKDWLLEESLVELTKKIIKIITKIENKKVTIYSSINNIKCEVSSCKLKNGKTVYMLATINHKNVMYRPLFAQGSIDKVVTWLLSN